MIGTNIGKLATGRWGNPSRPRYLNQENKQGANRPPVKHP